MFWMAAHFDLVCLIWHLSTISQCPTECKALGYGSLRGGNLALLAWCSLSNHLLFTLIWPDGSKTWEKYVPTACQMSLLYWGLEPWIEYCKWKRCVGRNNLEQLPLCVIEVPRLADWAVMKYSSLVLHAPEIATCFLSLKEGDLQLSSPMTTCSI